MSFEEIDYELTQLNVFMSDYINALCTKHDICFVKTVEFENTNGWDINTWNRGTYYGYKKLNLNKPMPEFRYTGEGHVYKLQKIYLKYAP